MLDKGGAKFFRFLNIKQLGCRVDRKFSFKIKTWRSRISAVSVHRLVACETHDDETRARVRKGARTKSERESSRSRATVSPPTSFASSKRRREKAFCLGDEIYRYPL